MLSLHIFKHRCMMVCGEEQRLVWFFFMGMDLVREGGRGFCYTKSRDEEMGNFERSCWRARKERMSSVLY